jgi:hypothetical protein
MAAVDQGGGMSLSVIGAGFGRTGTESMKMALEILGFGPCHHMKELNANPAQRALWRAIARGDRSNSAPDWEQAFADYRSCTDWPSAFYWRELSAAYPDAKIILTLRDAESWYASVQKTILKSIMGNADPDSVGVSLIAERVFGGRLDDRAHAIAVFEKNSAEVQAAFDVDRLLVHRLGDGWDALCRFLGKSVPDAPFPHSNSAAEFNAGRSHAQ